MDSLNCPRNIGYLKRLAKAMDLCTVKEKEQYYSLGIGLSSRCNFRCPMCYYHRDQDKTANQTSMSLSILGEILQRLPRLANITVGLEGEPFCHPQLFQALDLMVAKANTICLVSNGSLLTQQVCRTLAEYPIGLFALSIDADESASYAKFRVGGNFHTFLKHGACLAQYLEDAVRLHTVLFAENADHIVMMPKIATQMGIRHISLQQLRYHAAAQRRGITPASPAALEACLKKFIENAVKYDITLYFDSYFGNKTIMAMLYDFAKQTPHLKVSPPLGKHCPQIFTFTSILSEGRIFPCCGDFQPAKVASYSFDGIFNHEYLQCLRFLHSQGTSLAPCAQCRHEPFTSVMQNTLGAPSS